MTIRVNVNGGIALSIYDIKTDLEVTDKVNEEILTKLEMGEYSLGLASKLIRDENFEPIYRFEFEVEDDTEYDFEEIED
jgi:hypothetical protein